MERAKKEPEKKKRQYRTDPDLLRAFRYFDRTGATRALPTRVHSIESWSDVRHSS